MIPKYQIDHYSGQSYLTDMKAVEPKAKHIPVSEFKAHLTEYIRAIENGESPIQITRHGKVIATVGRPLEAAIPALLGAGKATGSLNESYDPQAPAFDEDDWEINH